VTYDDPARRALDWLSARGVDLAAPIEATLALGPQPHPYRRIRANRAQSGAAMTLSFKEWRIDFDVELEVRTIVVRRIRTGFRPRELEAASGTERLELHRSFAVLFG
jgi:hypothetical protein